MDDRIIVQLNVMMVRWRISEMKADLQVEEQWQNSSIRGGYVINIFFEKSSLQLFLTI